jgi:hypothetical protein
MNLDTQPHHHAFQLLLRDLHRLLEFVEPVDANEKTYSHRIFELLLRTCTEYESLCKHLLQVAGYESPERNFEHWNGRDFQALAVNRPLTKHQVRVRFWRPIKNVEPFQAWKNDEALPWYQNYNKVKHNRHEDFKKATLETLVDALAGLFEMLALGDPYPSFEDFNVVGHGKHGHFYIDEFVLECAGFDGTIVSGSSEELAVRTTAS